MYDFYQYQPEFFVLGDISKRKKVKEFLLNKREVMFKRIKSIFPYGKSFSTEKSEIVSMQEAIYNFGKKLYTYFDGKFIEVKIGSIVAQKELPTENGCKYKMFLTTFYDAITQILITKYLVVPK